MSAQHIRQERVLGMQLSPPVWEQLMSSMFLWTWARCTLQGRQHGRKLTSMAFLMDSISPLCDSLLLYLCSRQEVD